MQSSTERGGQEDIEPYAHLSGLILLSWWLLLTVVMLARQAGRYVCLVCYVQCVRVTAAPIHFLLFLLPVDSVWKTCDERNS